MVSRFAAAGCGLLAALAALAAARLAAGLTGPQAAPLTAVGSALIDLTPRWLEELAIRWFGSDDKTALVTGMTVAVAVLAAAVGLAAPRRRALSYGTLAGLGLTGGVAALSRPGSTVSNLGPSLVAVAAGLAALHVLRARLLRAFPPPAARPRPMPDAPADEPADDPADDLGDEPGDEIGVRHVDATPAAARGAGTAREDRRALLRAGAAVLGLAAAGEAGGRAITDWRAVADGTAARPELPAPADPAPALPAGTGSPVPGLSPFITPTAAFYRVDTALVVPRVPYRRWRLRVHGLAARPYEVSFDELLALPLIERNITLTCVSNEVGGPYVGTARWLGVDLAALLRRAGVRAGADQILSHSADGWTCSTPLEAVLDGRDALLAVGMNGQALPPEHGFPARMVVPGLYGYVSATKWVTDITLTRFADRPAYWTQRGWAERAPIKTASRIEVPKPFARLPAGPAVIAGTAWAQHRGVAAVEVRIDGGSWRQARLTPWAGPDTWRQWRLDWAATPGRHRVEVRATDVTGHVQPAARVPPFPDGATGWHSVLVTVT